MWLLYKERYYDYMADNNNHPNTPPYPQNLHHVAIYYPGLSLIHVGACFMDVHHPLSLWAIIAQGCCGSQSNGEEGTC